jgi:branched-chain amino acid transport system ATP-binding protein
LGSFTGAFAASGNYVANGAKIAADEINAKGGVLGKRHASLNNFHAWPSGDCRRAERCRGGEQQMLAIGRALMSRPKLILFNEPSLGLAPNIVERTFEIITEIRSSGTTVLMVEQNASAALDMCDHAYLLESGSLAMQGSGRDLIDHQHVRRAYLAG